MANVILVIGESGSGKSTSMRSLNPDKTVLVNCLNKGLPWRGSATQYSTEKKNLYHTTSYETITKLFEHVDKNRPEIENIIIDDAGYIMNTEMFERANETGWNNCALYKFPKLTGISLELYTLPIAVMTIV